MKRVRLRPAPQGRFVEVSALHALFVADLDAAARAGPHPRPPPRRRRPRSPCRRSAASWGRRCRAGKPGVGPRAAAPSARRLRPRQAPKRPSQRDVRPPPREGPRLADPLSPAATTTPSSTGELREDDKDENANARLRSSRKSVARRSTPRARARLRRTPARRSPGTSTSACASRAPRSSCACGSSPTRRSSPRASRAAVRTHLASTHPASDERVTPSLSATEHPATAALFAFLLALRRDRPDPGALGDLASGESKKMTNTVSGTTRGETPMRGADDPNNPNDWGGGDASRSLGRCRRRWSSATARCWSWCTRTCRWRTA